MLGSCFFGGKRESLGSERAGDNAIEGVSCGEGPGSACRRGTRYRVKHERARQLWADAKVLQDPKCVAVVLAVVQAQHQVIARPGGSNVQQALLFGLVHRRFGLASVT